MSSRSVAVEQTSRARSLHDKRPFNVAVFFAVIHYLCLIAFLTCAVILVLNPVEGSVMILIASLVGCLFSWLVSFFKRRSARCPLCKGSPLLDTGAVKHTKAFRLPPLNHGNTAVLGILFLQRFRCMYCGTPFDMLKKSSQHR
ncbi:hypothetical protein [Luteolibacter luteus]|uniref:Uncharacterized protein n=1 Tax=Luteolibacter luteus TaxID=2728835 RepID=A0A858REN7_9BACT|nr:hypothetical protein [Luteolibacter luteus]QJE95195.1 hypothetical protein HHL09_05200 [Luteolibacter luteus]